MAHARGTFPLDTVRRLLLDIEKSHPDMKQNITQIINLLMAIEREPASRTQSQRRKGEQTRYVVEIVNNRSVLAEYRPGSQPLRVSYDLFKAISTVLSTADKPLPFEDILEIVQKHMDAKPAEWQVRTVLRFLLRASPAIADRSRSRYRAINPRKFNKAAETWWRECLSPQ